MKDFSSNFLSTFDGLALAWAIVEQLHENLRARTLFATHYHQLTQLSEAGVPYISLLTDPTTGGVTASFAILGDLNIAEPGALIGFAGPRVVKETIGKDLPEGFQTSEFVLDHGFLDFIVKRHDLKSKLASLFRMLAN